MYDVIHPQYPAGRPVMNDVTEFCEEQLRYDEPMSAHCSWQAGGKAKRFFMPENSSQLSKFLRQLETEEPILWLGLGSNVLIRDGGFVGTVISTVGMSHELELHGAALVSADAGVPCPKLAKFTARHGLSGAEFFAGIPGTVGGALAMNAGAFGGETWRIVDSVRTIDRQGQIHRRTVEDYQIAYRTVLSNKQEWFLSAQFRLMPGDREEAKSKIKSLLAKRRDSQPMGMASCGSVFRNPEGDYAARLIEACGLKGTTIGGACISEKHANFILNLGNATASDIESLIELAKASVLEKFAVELEQEVLVFGQPSEQQAS